MGPDLRTRERPPALLIAGLAAAGLVLATAGYALARVAASPSAAGSAAAAGSAPGHAVKIPLGGPIFARPSASAPPTSTAPTTTTPTTRPAAPPLAGYVIAIDPGHNIGNWRYPAQIDRPVAYGPPGQTKPCDTTGTSTASGYTEAAYNLAVGLQVVAILRHEGAKVVMTPVNRVPWGPCITERAAIANRIHANAAVSIHADGSPSRYRGFYVIVPSYPLANVGLTAGMIRNDDRLGAAMLSAYHRITGMPVSNLYPSGYLRSEAYGGTDLSHVPKIFIETGNMPNPTDAALLESAAFRRRAALGIADGIRLFLTGRP